MPTIPIPCTNCLRFHYGVCREIAKECHKCGGLNHIERYCPLERRLLVDHRGPLPGTKVWCEMVGIDDDATLKKKVLDALKTAPGSAIWVNERCIYTANDKHFTQGEPERGRGRAFADREMRRRSRSPPRERTFKRSRSPSLWNRYPSDAYYRQRSPPRMYYYDYDEYREPSPRRHDRYRSRTPIRRRSPSPPPPRQQRPRSYASGSNAIVFEPKNRSSADLFGKEKKNKATHSLPPKLTVLGEVSANVSQPIAPAFHKPVIQNIPTPAKTAVQRSHVPSRVEALVDDPYFVLGVTEHATEAEITDAYELLIAEIEKDRIEAGVPSGPGAPPSIFDQSVQVLNAAKRLLLNY